MRRVFRILFAACVVVFLIIACAAAALLSGVYNFAADDAHTPAVESMIAKARSASIKSRAKLIQVPSLNSAEMIVAGAGNYQAMCVQCHLSPGIEGSELSAGLYPTPPNLSRTTVDPAIAFWTIKHGVKASGMPAWGRSMSDEDIWNLVAFLKALPTLDSPAYQQLVDKSAGHSHGQSAAVGAGRTRSAGQEHEDSGTRPRRP